jgi:fatty acid desaturase
VIISKDLRKELKPLMKSNNHRGLLAVLYDYIQIFLAIGLSVYFQDIFVYLLVLFFIGTRQRALATLLHDSAHRVLCANSKLNDFIGKYLSGYLIFQSFKAYARSHVILHHNFLGNAQKDPDYQYYLESGLFKNQDKKSFILKHLILPFALSKTPSFIIYLFKNRLGNIRDKEFIHIMLLWTAILLSCYHLGLLDVVLMYWFVPLVTTFPLISAFIEMGEHYPIIENRIPLEQTWNRFSSRFELFLTGMHNENYHLTHHLMPNIPYWNIVKAHDVLMKDSSYKAVNDKMGGILFSIMG